MSSILKGLTESYSRDEENQQNAMDTRRINDLSKERNAGLDEPDELPTSPVETRNGVYEYNVPAGQENIAKDLGLDFHKGHWFSRVPVQRANFQFGRPQFHEIPSKNVSEAEQDYGPDYQDKVKRLGQMAKQGERKTVYDPVKRVYKTVPVNPSKEQGVAEDRAISEDSIRPKLAAALTELGFKGPFKLGQLPQWMKELEDGRFDKDTSIMIGGNDPNYDPWVAKGYDYGYAYGMETGYQTGLSAQEVFKQAKADMSSQGGAEEQLDELKCWSGYTRVQGVPAGAPGSCKKKTNEEGVVEGVAETLPIDDAVKVLRHYGAGHFKTTSNELHFHKQGRPFSVDLVMNPDATRSVTLSSLNSATRGLKGQGVAEGSEKKTPGVALSKAYKKDFDDKKPGHTKPETALTGTYSKTGKAGGELKKQGVAEGQHSCPHCGGEMVSEELMNEKKDACYYKVKSRYKVWPSAYASGALVKCRKSGADSWGDGGKKNESSILEGLEQVDENLHQWFKEKWVRFGPDGKIRGDCARGDDSEGKPKCLPQSKAQNLGKKGRASAASRKRREDPNPERSGKAINVNTKKKSNEGVAEGSDNLNYIGNCTDDDVIEHIFGDATVFAQAVEEYGDEFVLDDLVVKYDPETDVHSFYYKKTGVAEGVEETNDSLISQVTELITTLKPEQKKQIADELRTELNVNEGTLKEKWSQKYKDSINCSNPKGFSQKAHCQGKKK